MNMNLLLSHLLILGIVGIMVSHAIALKIKRRFLLFDPLNLFWAGFIICYVVQPVSYGDVFRQWHTLGIYEETLLWALVGAICVILGYEMQVGKKVAYLFPRPPSHLEASRLKVFSLISICIGLLGYLYLVSTAGSLKDWLAVSRGATNWDKASGFLAQAEIFLPVGVGLLLFHVELHNKSSKRRMLAWLAAFVLLLWFFYLGTRSRTIGFVMIMLMAYYLPRKTNPSFFVVIPLFLSMMIVVSFQEHYRGYFYNLSIHLSDIDMDEAVRKVLPSILHEGGNSDYRNDISPGIEFNTVMTTVELVPSQVDYNYGYPLLEIFTRPIPRSLWHDKVYPNAEAMTPILDRGGLSYSYIQTSTKVLLMGPAFTFVGYWYAMAGALGVVLGGIFTGILLRSIRSYYDLSKYSEGVTIMFANLAMIGFGEAAATPLGWIYSLPLLIVPLFVALKWCGKNHVEVEGLRK